MSPSSSVSPASAGRTRRSTRRTRATSSRGRERLGDIIVGAGLEPANAVFLVFARGQHDDRHVGGCLVAAQAAADLDPAGAFDHPVEHDDVGRVFLGQQQRLVAVGRGADVDSLRARNRYSSSSASAAVVLDQQKLGLGHGRLRQQNCDRLVTGKLHEPVLMSRFRGRQADTGRSRRNGPFRRHWSHDRRSARDSWRRTADAPRC